MKSLKSLTLKYWIVIGGVVAIGVIGTPTLRSILSDLFPLFLLGACLIMHLFMHRSHGNHAHQSTPTNSDEPQSLKEINPRPKTIKKVF